MNVISICKSTLFQLHVFYSFSINSSCVAFTVNSNAFTSPSFQQYSVDVSNLNYVNRISYLYAVGMDGVGQDGAALATAVTETNTNSDNEEEDEEEEWELVEYENLNESDFVGSEWKMGTAWNKRNDIDTTWVRLVVDEKTDKNLAVWGDGGQGTWKVDEASQFFTVSQDTFGGWGGKKIWAGPIEDFYYLQGTVRGWNIITPAAVLAQWQMIRLGVDREEAGAAPWFAENASEEKEEEEKEE